MAFQRTPRQKLIDFIKDNLTIIALVILGLGLVTFALGPVRSFLANRPADAPINPNTANRPVAILLSGDTVDEESVSIARIAQPYTTIPDRPRDTVSTYTVQAGDTLFSIAAQFGLDPSSLFWANTDKLRDVHMMQAGMELVILPVDGVLHRSDETLNIEQIADLYSAGFDDIIFSEFNELSEFDRNYVPPWGMQIVVPGGIGEFTDFRPSVVEVVDQATGTVVRGFMPGMAGSCAVGIAGGGGTGVWTLPVGSPNLAQGFYPGHAGLDFAANTGTPALAADTGIVVFSGWVDASWGYGILVVLDHGNGFTTYYAHLSSVNVGCGQSVPRGSAVGQIGSTGNSSGPHLHFEIRTGDIPVDPSGFIAY